MSTMASALLHLRAFGALPCSSLPALPARRSGIHRGGVKSPSCLVRGTERISLDRCAVLRETWGAIGRRRGGGTWRMVAAYVGIPDDSSGVAVEDVVDDVVEDVEDAAEEQQLPPEEKEDRENIRDILRVVELLRTKRDMTFNEARLTIIIEDPRDVERRKLLNIEDDRGCSREELGNALVEVYEGRVPQDKVTLRELTKEMMNWPNLEDEIYPQGRPALLASPYAKATDTGVDPRIAAQNAKMDWDTASDIQPGDETKDLSEVLPPAVGFSFLYLISSLPIIIGIAVVAILFFNSLQ